MLVARRVFLLILALLLLLLLFAVPSVSLAQDAAQPSPLADAARLLAAKIAAALPPGAMLSLEVRNQSSLGAADLTLARRALESALTSAGLRLVPSSVPLSPGVRGPGPSAIRVTLSDSLSSCLLVAEGPLGSSSLLGIVSARDCASLAERSTPSMILGTERMLERESPILDLMDLPDSSNQEQRIAVLGPGQIEILKRIGKDWRQEQVIPLPRLGRVWRDPRGSIDSFERGLAVHFHSEGCEVLQADPNRNRCYPVDSQLSPFSSSTLFGTERGPGGWYSAARLNTETQSLTVIAAINGTTEILTATGKGVVIAKDWGSDLAAIRSDCGSLWQLLTTRNGDWTVPDSIAAYEVRDLVPVAVSQPVSFSGPVTALGSVYDYRTAIAVTRNLRTGRYEAYRLTISCGK